MSKDHLARSETSRHGACARVARDEGPMNQVAIKVVPALAAGNTVVLKPSEIAPLSALRFAELIDAAGFPPGTLNLVNGDGRVAGAALAAHPRVDLLSFTGSTAAGVQVSQAAATTTTRLSLELGGKGPNLIFGDVGEGLRRAVERGVAACMRNSGQSARTTAHTTATPSAHVGSRGPRRRRFPA